MTVAVNPLVEAITASSMTTACIATIQNVLD
jgi:hypothetical protein